jgi:large subunit ribosomal protein L15
MKLKQRKKSTRIRGSRTAGWGFRQSHKGHGSKGGWGMSGSGKRGDHMKQKSLMLAKAEGAKTYFGKQGLTSRGTARRKGNVINLAGIRNNFFEKEGAKIVLKKYKILGNGDGFKGTIEAKAASKLAIEKMKKAGGEIIIIKKEGNDKVEKKVVKADKK